jgi:hypothetical protein
MEESDSGKGIVILQPLFTGAQLSLPLGRENVVLLGVRHGAAGEFALFAMSRLYSYCADEDGDRRNDGDRLAG